MGCLGFIVVVFCLVIISISEHPANTLFLLSFVGLLIYTGYRLSQYMKLSKASEIDEEAKAQDKKKLLMSASVCVVCLVGVIATNPSLPPPEEVAQRKQKIEEDTKIRIEENKRIEAEREAKKKKEEEEAALQKKYDDQKKYEEWLEWKKQEAARQAQKAEEDQRAEQERRRKEQERRREEENKYQRINISALLNEIRSNAARAKHNYNDKYVKMEGIVLAIESDGDNVVISDGEYNITPAVHCLPSKKNQKVREQIYRINKGQYITVYGKITNIGEIIGCYLELDKIQ